METPNCHILFGDLQISQLRKCEKNEKIAMEKIRKNGKFKSNPIHGDEYQN